MRLTPALGIQRCLTVDYCSCFTGVVFGEAFEIGKHWKGT